MTDQLLLQTILQDVRELRDEVGELHKQMAHIRGGWRAIGVIGAIIGGVVGSVASVFGRGA